MTESKKAQIENVLSSVAVADLMALIDTYADTACANGIRSGWSQMARASVLQSLVDKASLLRDK